MNPQQAAILARYRVGNQSMQAQGMQRGPMGHCPPYGLQGATNEQVAALHHNVANPNGYAGQGAACPPSSQNVNDNRYSCQAGMCAEQPPVCGCNVIGANTFAIAPQGVVPAATAALAIDAGDTCRYQPRSLFIAAYRASTVAGENELLFQSQLTDGCVECPVVLTNARVGTIPMIRRTGANQFGILSQAYSDRKELTCVDWAPFTSVQNQGLTMDFLQINSQANYHIFVVLWGDNLG